VLERPVVKSAHHISVSLHVRNLLFGNSVYRCVVVEAKVTGVDDVVGFCVARQLVQLTKVACRSSREPMTCRGKVM
jgi:hypothetical protein